MGGHNAGEMASCIAAKRIGGEMTRIMLKKDDLSYERIATFFQEVIKGVNREIRDYSQKHPEYQGMGTTVTAALVMGNHVYIGHVGDSRAYIIDEEGMRQITKDHSLVQEMVDKGSITREEARIHPQKNVITRTVGIHEDVEVDVYTEYIHGGVLLLCCDGLTDMVTDEEIYDIIVENEDPQKICDTLVKTANEKGGLDNISVIALVDESDETVIVP